MKDEKARTGSSWLHREEENQLSSLVSRSNSKSNGTFEQILKIFPTSLLKPIKMIVGMRTADFRTTQREKYVVLVLASNQKALDVLLHQKDTHTAIHLFDRFDEEKHNLAKQIGGQPTMTISHTASSGSNTLGRRTSLQVPTATTRMGPLTPFWSLLQLMLILMSTKDDRSLVVSSFTTTPSLALPRSIKHNVKEGGGGLHRQSSSNTRLHYIREAKEDGSNKNQFDNPLQKQETMGSTETVHRTEKEEVTPKAAKTAAFTSKASENPNAKAAVDEVLEQHPTGSSTTADLIFLFVGQYHADSFSEIVEYAQQQIQSFDETKNIEVVAVLGGGVIGGGNELDRTNTPAMSSLIGKLPPNAHANVFSFHKQDVEETGISNKLLASPSSTSTSNTTSNKSGQQRPPSYMVFADPLAPLEELLTHLHLPSSTTPPPVIAGGVTVPPPRHSDAPSLARNGQMLPAGSLIGVSFTGNVGLMAVVAQGCRPVGPTFVITKATHTVLTELSGESAIRRLEQVANDADERDAELIRNGEVVCGIGSSEKAGITICESKADDHTNNHDMDNNANDDDDEDDTMCVVEDDFLIRQIKGFQPRSQSIVLAAHGLEEGKTFQFHVRAAQSAREDLDLMVKRAKTERLFAGRQGKALCAFQFSCVARGSSFYGGASNVDCSKVKELFGDCARSSNSDDNDASHHDISSPPIAGFFANGEIGPVGIR